MVPLSIVLPCYNPAPGWETAVLQGYNSFKESAGFDPELIIVNDGSKTPLSETAIAFLSSQIPYFQLLGYPDNQGKGAALRYGVARCQGQSTLFTDIDFPYTSDSLMKIWQGLREGNDIVVGIKDDAYYQNVPAARVWISKSLRKLSGLFLRLPITDTQCGLKGFNTRGKSVFLNTTIDRYLCDLEFLYKAFGQPETLKIKPQQVTLKEGVQFRKMSYRILLRESVNFFAILLKRR